MEIFCMKAVKAIETSMLFDSSEPKQSSLDSSFISKEVMPAEQENCGDLSSEGMTKRGPGRPRKHPEQPMTQMKDLENTQMKDSETQTDLKDLQKKR